MSWLGITFVQQQKMKCEIWPT